MEPVLNISFNSLMLCHQVKATRLTLQESTENSSLWTPKLCPQRCRAYCPKLKKRIASIGRCRLEHRTLSRWRTPSLQALYETTSSCQVQHKRHGAKHTHSPSPHYPSTETDSSKKFFSCSAREGRSAVIWPQTPSDDHTLWRLERIYFYRTQLSTYFVRNTV
jgi:hypothetical protein